MIRLTAACDTGKARATFVNGELRVTIPKIEEQRGRTLRIPVTSGQPPA